MKKNKLIRIVSHNFHDYKMSCTMLFLGLSAGLGILGNEFGMVYLVFSFLPVFVWSLFWFNERKTTDTSL
ncbi:hypothetical protein LL037_01305 [Clostridium estertheticum]|uniref:Uncharacterized protein n=1 Tax=Clostridium estertheticum TaxID=238834 RepID=A0AA47EH07_9CLOT|nr:hypothetical protein [Clostridium estertheticum]MBU3155588.1 hypothetical protein [Clostridium estertheticum]MBU3198111.1 hypothetical protein [Clostridium estertheticum]WAG60017.1 hypothetical protein LL038_21145 [Clostridium estertheticum]WAG65903.1 hypothetical protein LL037_01305 [Clostridium estertheticum]